VTDEIRAIIDKKENQKLFRDTLNSAARIGAYGNMFSALVFYVSIFDTFEVEEAYFREYYEAKTWLEAKAKSKEKNAKFFACYIDGSLREHS